MATAMTFEREIEAGLLHDARDSLAALRLLVDAVRDGVIEATPASGTVDQMSVHIRLLGALLDAHGDGRERRSGAAGSVCIDSLLAQWVDAMAPKARQRHVRLCLVVAPDLPAVHCQPDQISRVLLNLISNAICHSPVGADVVVRGVPHPGGVQIQVDDSGPGLPAHVRAAVLESASPVQPPGCVSGLGLTIARSIVRAHGGALWAGSPPSGASLRFYLPAAAKGLG